METDRSLLSRVALVLFAGVVVVVLDVALTCSLYIDQKQGSVELSKEWRVRVICRVVNTVEGFS